MRGHYHWPLIVALEGAAERIGTRIIRAIDGVAVEKKKPTRRTRKPRKQEPSVVKITPARLIYRNDNITLLPATEAKQQA